MTFIRRPKLEPQKIRFDIYVIDHAEKPAEANRQGRGARQRSNRLVEPLGSVAGTIRSAAIRLDPDQAVAEIRPMERIVAATTAQQQFTSSVSAWLRLVMNHGSRVVAAGTFAGLLGLVTFLHRKMDAG